MFRYLIRSLRPEYQAPWFRPLPPSFDGSQLDSPVDERAAVSPTGSATARSKVGWIRSAEPPGTSKLPLSLLLILLPRFDRSLFAARFVESFLGLVALSWVST